VFELAGLLVPVLPPDGVAAVVAGVVVPAGVLATGADAEADGVAAPLVGAGAPEDEPTAAQRVGSPVPTVMVAGFD